MSRVYSKLIKDKLWYDDYEYQYEYRGGKSDSIDVSEEDISQPIFSGLLDKDGDRLVYYMRRNPIGFIHFNNDDED